MAAIANKWFVDLPTAATVAQADLTNFSLGAPAFGTVHMCSGFSRVQIIHFIRGDDADINVTKIYFVNPVNGKQGAGIDPNTVYLTIPLATISWVSSLVLGIAPALNVLDRFSDGVTVTPLATTGLELFAGGAPIQTSAVEFSPADDSIGFASLILPQCWGLVTTWKAKEASTTASNHLLKFS